MRFIPRALGTALATGAVLAVAAVPAVAATNGPSLSTAMHDVHAANVALSQLKHNSKHNSKKARKELAQTRSEIAAAAHQARWLHGTNASSSATAFENVATQYNADVKAFTSMIPSTTGSLQSSLAQALISLISGRTQALGFLGELTSSLPTSGTSTATSTLSSLLGSLPSQLSSLTSLTSLGNLPSQIEQLIAQAISATGSVLDAGVTQLEGLIPSLPTSVQPIVSGVLNTLSTTFGSIKSILTTATSTIGSLLGGVVGSQLGQISSLLQSLLGNLPNIFGGILGSGTGSSSGSGSGTGTGTGSSTSGIFSMLPFGIGNLLNSLLGSFNISMPGLGSLI